MSIPESNILITTISSMILITTFNNNLKLHSSRLKNSSQSIMSSFKELRQVMDSNVIWPKKEKDSQLYRTREWSSPSFIQKNILKDLSQLKDLQPDNLRNHLSECNLLMQIIRIQWLEFIIAKLLSVLLSFCTSMIWMKMEQYTS